MPQRTAAARRRLATATLVAATVSALTLTSLPAFAAPAAPRTGTTQPAVRAEQGSVNKAFTEAAARHGVPRDLLVALGWHETHLDGHGGAPSQANGFGVMHLVDNPVNRTLPEAAGLTGRPAAELRTDTAANIDGAAAVLRSYADEQGLSAADRRDPGAWYQAVARYSGAKKQAATLYADGVHELLTKGLLARVGSGRGAEALTVIGRQLRAEKGPFAEASRERGEVGTRSEDYPPALWVPASPANFAAGRTAAIDKVVIHVTQGSYAGSISWFQNPEAQVSAHYVVRSSDGEVTQTVRDGDTAWHARDANASALGIEHEGYVDDPTWFTEPMYQSSAALTRHLTGVHGIPRDRAHIVGHSEVPGNDHTDPGPNWNWDHYMQLVGGGAGSGDGISFSSYSTLKSGASGEQVKALQTLLEAQSFDPGAADGKYGPTTLSAVKAFQQSRKLTADGVVGPKSWTALLSAGQATTIRAGSTGEPVKRLQRALTAALGRSVGIDGSFGPATTEALRSYQTSRKLEVDGIAGPGTWAALQAGR